MFLNSPVYYRSGSLPPVRRRTNSPWRARCSSLRMAGFTFMELMMVIILITILAGMLFPSVISIQDRARKVQAKNDLTQIVNAVNAFNTEYGVYPSTFAPEMTYDGLNGNTNDKLFNALRGSNLDTTTNPRNVVFISPPPAKKQVGGIGTDGQYYDPWGKPYVIRLDTNFDNVIINPYTQNAGFAGVNAGVIAWSFGTDKLSASVPGPAPDKNTGTDKDDVISWQ